MPAVACLPAIKLERLVRHRGSTAAPGRDLVMAPAAMALPAQPLPVLPAPTPPNQQLSTEDRDAPTSIEPPTSDLAMNPPALRADGRGPGVGCSQKRPDRMVKMDTSALIDTGILQFRGDG